LLKIAGDHNKIEEGSHAPVGRNVKRARVCRPVGWLFGLFVRSLVRWLLLRDVARCADACTLRYWPQCCSLTLHVPFPLCIRNVLKCRPYRPVLEKYLQV